MDELGPDTVDEAPPEAPAESPPEAAPEPPEPPPPDPKVDKLLEKVTLLEQLFVKRIKDDQVHAAAYQTLYKEMIKYRDDALRSWQKPILKGLVLLYDTVKRSFPAVEDPAGREAIQLHLEEVLELLHRNDVELMKEEPETFDPTVQNAIGTEEASGLEEHQKVSKVVRDGFRWGPLVLRPQEVIIKVHKTS